MALGAPIAVTFIVGGFLSTAYLVGIKPAFANLGIIPWGQSLDYGLICVPLFVWMGELCYYAGISQELYAVCQKWFGHLRGGLAIATLAACTGFAACSGASTAAAATMGLVAYPEMKKYGYSDSLSTGTIAAGGTLAVLIPPSTLFIIYGTIAEESIGKLFIAGIIPGLILSGLFMLGIVVQIRLNPRLVPNTSHVYPWRERIRTLPKVWAVLALFLLVMGGLLIGVFTATEAGAVGALGAFALALAKRKLSWENISKSLNETGRITCMILFILIGALMFNYFLARSGLPMWVAETTLKLPVPPLLIVGAMLMVYIPLGCVMSVASMMVLTLPLFTPAVQQFGFSLVWFGVLVVILGELAQITPPVGLVVFALKGVIDVPLGEIFRGCTPFFICILICAALVFAFPQLALFLPALMK